MRIWGMGCEDLGNVGSGEWDVGSGEWDVRIW